MWPITLISKNQLKKSEFDIIFKVDFCNTVFHSVPIGLLPLILLYVNRNYHIWKDADLLPWLEKNVHEVLDRVDRKDPAVEDCREKILRRFATELCWC